MNSKNRPTLDYMGYWKWLAGLLIAVCFIFILPYAQRAGNMHALSGDRNTAKEIFGCQIQVQFRENKARFNVSARIEPKCNKQLKTPMLQIRSGENILEEQRMRGSANSLRGRISIPSNAQLDSLQLLLRLEDTSGHSEIISWPVSLASPS